jgi:hypothetical protein
MPPYTARAWRCLYRPITLSRVSRRAPAAMVDSAPLPGLSAICDYVSYTTLCAIPLVATAILLQAARGTLDLVALVSPCGAGTAPFLT